MKITINDGFVAYKFELNGDKVSINQVYEKIIKALFPLEKEDKADAFRYTDA